MNFSRLAVLALAGLSSLTCIAKPKQETLPQQPKYVFYFISDGTGINTVLGTEIMLSELKGEIGRTPLWMSQSPVVGVSSTYSASSDVTDSAASGTALASGVKTYNGAIGVYPDSVTHAIGIAQKAHEKGYVVGIGSSCPVNHATPGAQFAHVRDRNMYYEIARQMSATGFEFFGGGSINLERAHNKPEVLDSIYNALRKEGYTICFTNEDYEREGKKADKLLMLQDPAVGSYALPYWMDRKEGQVTIVDQFRAELELLYRKAQEKKTGFYLFNEVGGEVDFACHAQDGAAAFNEVLAADSCFRLALDFYYQHPDETLIVLTSDHETGGMSLGCEYGGYKTNFKLLQYQKASLDAANQNMFARAKKEGGISKISWESAKDQLTEDFGLWKHIPVTEAEEAHLKELFDKTQRGEASDTKTLYASSKAFMTAALHLVQKKAHVGWTTGSHTAGLVPVYAIGVGKEAFMGHNDNAEIPMKIARIAGY